ncbi:MAG TPA: NACHT domain-containing protein, partial [Anaerolineae bacterium]|nr:NACHT domain-containing protein [Anaerolineae bacterium]
MGVSVADVTAGRDVVTVGGDYVVQGEDGLAPEVARRAYLEQLRGKMGRLQLSGVDPKVAADRKASRLALGAVYTALLTSGGSGEEMLMGEAEVVLGEGRGRGGERGRMLSATEQINRHKYLVLLGDPGSGKSTFVRFVALCMAGACLGDEALGLNLLQRGVVEEDGEERQLLWEHGALLPVVVVLRQLAANGLPSVGERATANDLWLFIVGQLEGMSLGSYGKVLQSRWLEEGGLLLLDGLDEVPAAEQRRVQIKEMVSDFTTLYPRVRIVVTSRTYAYQRQDWRLPDFEETVLAPFSEGQIKQFIESWYAHIGPLREMSVADAQGRAARLKEVALGNRRLRVLAERPLLLTLMASLHAWHGGSLPEKREALYAEAVALLLDVWESPKVLYGAGGEVVSRQRSLGELLKVGRERVQSLLAELAYQVHGAQVDLTDTADIGVGDLVAGLMQLDENRDEEMVNPALLVEYLEHRAGLLLPRGNGVYTFPHRTFQEYLAACHLADYGYPEEVARLARQEPNRWREVALLAGAKAFSGGAFAIWPLVNELCFERPEAAEDREAAAWGAQLAGQALVELVDLNRVSQRNERTVALVKEWLLTIMRGKTLPAVERGLAATNLGKLGELREEVMKVDGMMFGWVPAGAFLMGDGEEWHEVAIAYGYGLGRYPVTQAQFGLFVSEGGYEDERWWAEGKRAEVWQEGRCLGRRGPYDYGERFRGVN